MIVIGLGGNVGTDAEIIGRFEQAAALLGPARWAKLYRTVAIGQAQAPFLNTAIAVDLDTDPMVHEIEERLGRERDVRWGPRTIDLDVLVWDDRVISTTRLTVPHPRLHERRFALQPLVDLVGEDFMIPGIGRAGDALARVKYQEVTLLGELGEVRAMRVDE